MAMLFDFESYPNFCTVQSFSAVKRVTLVLHDSVAICPMLKQMFEVDFYEHFAGIEEFIGSPDISTVLKSEAHHERAVILDGVAEYDFLCNLSGLEVNDIVAGNENALVNVNAECGG